MFAIDFMSYAKVQMQNFADSAFALPFYLEYFR